MGALGLIGVWALMLPQQIPGKPLVVANQSNGSPAFGLNQLVIALSMNPLRQVHFEEHFVSHVLTKPITKTGRLSYSPPSRFAKHIVTPLEESFVVEEDTLYYENKSRGISQALSLQDYPPLQALIEGLRSIFSGDLKKLQRHYDTDLSGTAGQWVLTMVPHEEDTQQSVKFIRLKGMGNYMKEIEIHEPNGDFSTLLLKES